MNQVLLKDGTIINTHNQGEYVGNWLLENRDYYEPNLLSFLKKYFTSLNVAVDIGANIGSHSLFFKNVLNAQKVICFEPLQSNFEILVSNCNNKGFELVNKALGEEQITRYIEVFWGEGNMGHAGFSDKGEQVQVTTLDEFYKGKRDKIDLIKIDIEGAEHLAIDGALKTIKRFKPLVVCEHHTDLLHRSAFLLLKPHGYKLLGIIEDDNLNYVYEVSN